MLTALNLGDWFRDTALDGSLVLAVPVAVIAGLVSFFSPCVVPLLPGYLSYTTGLSGADLVDGKRGRMFAGSLLFVLGFSFVFVSFGALFGAVGGWLFEYQREITVVLGSFTILLGLVFIGVVPWMQRDLRFHRVPAVGLAAAPLLGVLFGLGWAPCIGPTLQAVTTLALKESSAGRGALLSFFYCLGLGLPFIAAALAYRRTLGAVGWVRRHQRWVTAFGGLMLVAVGLLLVTGWWDVHGRLGPDLVLPQLHGGCVVTSDLSSGPALEPSSRPATGYEPPPLGPRELLRWGWRQLTSMRTALILLFLLALASIPGSVVPQDTVDSLRASQWRGQHPELTPIYEKLGLFSVYNSPWFSAIYILLMISLVGCIVPRLRVYWRGVRARPPAAPRNLGRLPQFRTFETDEPPDVALERARALLRKRRFRVDATPEGDGGALSSERGYLREAGNLLFHLSVLIVLVGFALGGLWGFKGGVIVVAKDSFANTLSQYDDFRAGSLFDPADLSPFEFTVNNFDVTFIREGREAGMAHKFAADLTYRASPGQAPRDRRISVNHPLTVGGTDVFLISHGYAPHLTVRNADRSVAYSGPVVFLPEDSTFRSFGVVKVPDAEQADGATQLGLEGEFYPTYGFIKGRDGGPFSAFPDAKNPALSMLVWKGDLGLDGGASQSVYALKKEGLRPVLKADGKPVRLDLAMGASASLPDGLGTVTFDGLSRYVKLQVSHTPGQKVALAGVVLALVGLLASLFIRPRRIWVRTRRVGGATVVEVAGLDRSSGGDLSTEVDALTEALNPPEGTTPAGASTSATTPSGESS